jgi:hypothetical protein
MRKPLWGSKISGTAPPSVIFAQPSGFSESAPSESTISYCSSQFQSAPHRVRVLNIMVRCDICQAPLGRRTKCERCKQFVCASCIESSRAKKVCKMCVQATQDWPNFRWANLVVLFSC